MSCDVGLDMILCDGDCMYSVGEPTVTCGASELLEWAICVLILVRECADDVD